MEQANSHSRVRNLGRGYVYVNVFGLVSRDSSLKSRSVLVRNGSPPSRPLTDFRFADYELFGPPPYLTSDLFSLIAFVTELHESLEDLHTKSSVFATNLSGGLCSGLASPLPAPFFLAFHSSITWKSSS